MSLREREERCVYVYKRGRQSGRQVRQDRAVCSKGSKKVCYMIAPIYYTTSILFSRPGVRRQACVALCRTVNTEHEQKCLYTCVTCAPLFCFCAFACARGARARAPGGRRTLRSTVHGARCRRGSSAQSLILQSAIIGSLVVTPAQAPAEKSAYISKATGACCKRQMQWPALVAARAHMMIRIASLTHLSSERRAPDHPTTTIQHTTRTRT
jgi:hypothetical protein